MQVSRIGIDDSVEVVFPPGVIRDELADLDVTVEVIDGSPESLVECDAVVTFAYREAYLDAVDWIHTIQAGVDRFPLDEVERAGVVLTNSTGIHGPAIGESVACYMLLFGRRFHRAVANQQRQEWQQPGWDETFTIAGESLCVVGLGTLGQGIVDRASALGLEITGVRRSGAPVEGVERVYAPDDLHTAVADARFVAIAVPLNEQTRHLIGSPEFDAMRDDAVIVNVARGPVVDQAALIDAIEGGEIAGAALDVFETEPLPTESPLWDMDEVVITPHQAGFTVDYYRLVGDLVRRNVEARAVGDDWVNRVV